MSETGAVCSSGGGPSVIFGGKFVLLGNSTLGGVGVVLVDHADLASNCTFAESSILASDFVAADPLLNPNGRDDGPLPFMLLKLFKLDTAAETNAAEDEDEEDVVDVIGVPGLIAPPGRGPLCGKVLGSV